MSHFPRAVDLGSLPAAAWITTLVVTGHQQDYACAVRGEEDAQKDVRTLVFGGRLAKELSDRLGRWEHSLNRPSWVANPKLVQAVAQVLAPLSFANGSAMNLQDALQSCDRSQSLDFISALEAVEPVPGGFFLGV